MLRLLIGIYIITVIVLSQSNNNCLGEFAQCNTTNECTMSVNDCNKYCGSSASGKYVCPISKQCVDTVADYMNCPGIKGTFLDWTLSIDDRIAFLLKNLTLDEKYPQLTNKAPEILRLGIPSYNWLNDDVHSVRNVHATVFPDGCGMGATWSKKDANIVGNTVGLEARGLHNSLVHGGNRGTFNGAGITAYGPNMNLVRDPRWGRSQEVYSEDPRLSGHLTYYFVTGYQNGGAQNDKYILLASCCKHYAAYDLEDIPNTSIKRQEFNAIVDAVNWAETYAPVFRECVVRANVQHIMCSYNSINSVPTCGSKDILTTVLRNQWNFEGFVVSDYDAMRNIYTTHNYTANLTDAVALAIKAGCDQEGGSNAAINKIPTAVQEGKLTEDDINLAFKRLYRTRFMLGMFDPPTMVEYNNITNDSKIEGPEHLNLSRKVAQDSMTLYKNKNNVLPLDPSKVTGITVIGPQAVYPSLLTGNYVTYPDKGCFTIMQALREGLGEKTNPECTVQHGVFYNGSLYNTKTYDITECCKSCYEDTQCNYWSYYKGLCYFGSSNKTSTNIGGSKSGQCTNKPTSKIQNAIGCQDVACANDQLFNNALDLINSMQKNNKLSAIIILLGLDQKQEKEGHDRTVIELPGMQNELVAVIANNSATQSVPKICVLIHGGTMALGKAASECDAILDAWYPGQMGGYAIADAIYGIINPAGRASVTSYMSTSQLPTYGEMNEYAGNGITYRYFKGEVLYPFGYGISYTNFKYSNL
eukprot:550831_1